jgi:hypothetical protein
MSGAGKSTLLAEFAVRGWSTVDADDTHWCIWDESGDPGWVWREDRIISLFGEPRPRPLVVAGTVPNLGIVPWDLRVLLSAPLPVLLERIATRTGNDYGKSLDEREAIIGHHRDVEPLLRRWAHLELDATQPVGVLADRVEAALP